MIDMLLHTLLGWWRSYIHETWSFSSCTKQVRLQWAANQFHSLGHYDRLDNIKVFCGATMLIHSDHCFGSATHCVSWTLEGKYFHLLPVSHHPYPTRKSTSIATVTMLFLTCRKQALHVYTSFGTFLTDVFLKDSMKEMSSGLSQLRCEWADLT